MRSTFLIFFSIFIISCSNKKKNSANVKVSKRQQIHAPKFQNILDQSNAKGSLLIYDFQKDTYYSNDFDWANTGKLPASTYKIPHSMIALETGVVENESAMFAWDGEPRALAIWEKDLRFNQAFQLSCMPCYQEIARKIGVDRMNSYLRKLEYDIMKVDSNTIDKFWLEGASRISQF